jgi:hypothetical protein
MQNRLITDDMAQAAFDWLASNSDDIAHARGAQIRTEYRCKKILAKEFLKAEGSVEVRKAIATCSEEYADACEDHAAAEAQWEKLKDQRNKLELLIEAWRTQASNERGLMRASR